MNCLNCYEDYLTNDRNTCYNYLKKNAFSFYNLTEANDEEFYHLIQMDSHLAKFTTPKYLKNNMNMDETTLDLGNCEYLLKESYGLPENNSFYDD